MAEITKVQMNIRKFLSVTKDIACDKDKCFEWFNSFRNTLLYQEFEEEQNEYAMEILEDAKMYNFEQRKKGMLSSAKKALVADGNKKPTKEEVASKMEEMFADELKELSPEEEEDKGFEMEVLGYYEDDGTFVTKEEADRRWAENEKAEAAEKAKNASKRSDQLIWGRFENVYLSNDERNELMQTIGNINELDKVIDSLSCELAEGKTESKNHFATLQRWISARMNREQGSAPRYESVTEHNRRVVEQGRKIIHELCKGGN